METQKLKMAGAGFAGIFSSWKPWDRGEESKPVALVPAWDSGQRGRSQYTCALSPYCLVSGERIHQALNAEPTARVVEYFKAHVLAVPYDTLYFQIIIRDNGTALIAMHHNQIIGSHWLDIVPVDGLPAGVIGGE